MEAGNGENLHDSDLVITADDQRMQSIDGGGDRVGDSVVERPTNDKHKPSINQRRQNTSGQTATELSTSRLSISMQCHVT